MSPDGDLNGSSDRRFLNADEPLPFRILNGGSEQPRLLVCDHASRRFPAAVGDLGLDELAQRCHLAWDIGAGALTERVADALGVTAVLAEYSRLVVDLNRDLTHESAFLEFSDGVVVQGNRGLTPTEKDRRAADVYWPYHHAIGVELKRLANIEYPPALVSVHSFTPVFNGVARPWEIGILWDTDAATARIALDGFRAAGFVVGDNEPYTGKGPMDFTVDHHAEAAKLPHVGIEIRQDLIADDAGVSALAGVLADIVARIPAGRARATIDAGAPAGG